MPTFDFDIFYTAALAWRLGANPYAVHGFYNPIWALVPFLPLTFLPFDIARQAWIVITLLVALIALWRLGVRGAKLAVIALGSSFIWLMILFSNVDALVLLGASLFPALGVWFLLIKPQMGFILIVWWVIAEARNRAGRRLMILLVSLGAALVWQLSTFGLPRIALGELHTWNAAIWPLGIPMGIGLVVLAFRARSQNAALAASPFLSPYVGVSSWLGVIPLMALRWRSVLILIGGSWLMAAHWRGIF